MTGRTFLAGLAALVAVLIVGTPSFGQCGPGAGSCGVPNGTPGCDDVECCMLICQLDPFCCQVEWDQMCVDDAAIFCDLGGCPGGGSCFRSNGTPGCDDVACCEAVCDFDPFCCDVQWDQKCADLADNICGDDPCPADTNDDGVVDVDDLVNVVLAWGTADPDADVNGDGTVDVDDLVDVILAWGPC